MEKLPPIAKVYEAYSAIADQRVELKTEEAYVTSSDEEKTYTIRFQEFTYSSNDNATVWQHYAGYPILAVLMLQGKLPLKEELLAFFKHVPWKEMNTRFHNDYDLAIDAFLMERGHADEIKKAMQECLDAYKKLDIVVKGNRAKIIKKIE